MASDLRKGGIELPQLGLKVYRSEHPACEPDWAKVKRDLDTQISDYEHLRLVRYTQMPVATVDLRAYLAYFGTGHENSMET